MNVKTAFPDNVFSVIPKVLVLCLVLFFAMDNKWAALGTGLLVGLILHLNTSYYDCSVILNNGVIKFFFLRPFSATEQYNLTTLDSAVLVKENKEKTQRDTWWKTESLLPYSYDTLVLKKGDISYDIRFSTNQKDLSKLEAALQEIANRKV